jgi:hypothetical protein
MMPRVKVDVVIVKRSATHHMVIFLVSQPSLDYTARFIKNKNAIRGGDHIQKWLAFAGFLHLQTIRSSHFHTASSATVGPLEFFSEQCQAQIIQT